MGKLDLCDDMHGHFTALFLRKKGLAACTAHNKRTTKNVYARQFVLQEVPPPATQPRRLIHKQHTSDLQGEVGITSDRPARVTGHALAEKSMIR